MIDELFLKNERDTNKAVAYFVIIFSALITIVGIVFTLQYLNSVGKWGTIIAAAVSFIVLLIGIYSSFFYKKHWIKYLLMISVIILSSILFFFYSSTAVYMIYVAMILSIKYYDVKFVRKVAITSWIFINIAIISNYILHKHLPIIFAMHIIQEEFFWRNWNDVLIYKLLPRSIITIFAYFICAWISKSGRSLVIEQAKITEQAANLQAEINTSLAIQEETLPDSHTSFFDNGIEVNAVWKPARELGGDFYDYYVKGSCMTFVIADVSDKGFPAAMFVMRIQSALRYALWNGEDFEEIIKSINNYLVYDCKSDMFVTMWIGIIDYNSGIGRFINAGHNEPLIKHKDGKVEFIKNEPDLFLGMLDDVSPKAHILEIKEGDTILLYTDGVTDAQSAYGESYGIEKLYNEVKVNNNVFEAVENSLHIFTNNAQQFDDITFVEIKFNKIKSDFTEGNYKFNASFENISKAIDYFIILLQKAHAPQKAYRDIAVIIDEVCSNIFEYAYKKNEKEIEINYKLYSNCIKMEFVDTGEEFNPIKSADPKIKEGETQIGGFGIYFVKNLASEVNYKREDNKNKLLITKVWKPREFK